MMLSLSGMLIAALCGAWVDDSTLTSTTLSDIKNATVFIKVESDQLTKSGSGFVIRADEKGTYIVTNQHVIATTIAPGPGSDGRVVRTITLKNPKTSIVFRSGTKDEQSLPAEILAEDEEVDLAVLKVGPVKGIKPLVMASSVDLVETMPVYTFGFPFGSALSLAKKNPAITVGKGAVSSIRLNDAGEVGLIQLDGSLNPGNSGGPVVDAKGRLVGVAVATIRNSSGIGFAVPGAELQKVLDGRVGDVKLLPGKDSDKKSIVEVNLNLVDPFSRIKSVTLHYLPFEAKFGNKAGSNEPLESVSGARKLKMAVEKHHARGEFTVPSSGSSREYLLQAVWESQDGKTVLARISRTKLAGKETNEAVAESPRAGRPSLATTRVLGGTNLDAVAKDRGPENGRLIGFQVRTSRTSRIRAIQSLRAIYDGPEGEALGQQFGSGAGAATTVKAKEGYAVGGLTGRIGARFDGFSVTFMRVRPDGLDPKDSYESDWIGVERPGVGLKIGGNGGFAVGIVCKVRANDISGLGLIVEQTGRSSPAPEGSRPPSIEANRPSGGGSKPTGNETEIMGGAFDPVFRDAAPEGGRLIGLEVGLGKFINTEVIHAIRPVFWTQHGEVLGVQHGTDTSKVVKLKAKAGYAVGSVTVRTGMNMDGLSVTFMRVQGDHLLTNDSYESEWVGHRGGREAKLGGSGAFVTGIIGKANAKDSSGLGLLFGKSMTGSVSASPKTQAGDDRRPHANGNIPGSNETTIMGGGSDREFKDAAPEGGRLIGFEIGLGKFLKNDVIRAVRPIFWTPDGEVMGKQYGTDISRVVKVKAKDGYAVGGVIAKAGLTMDGMSVTFMRVEGDHLSTKETYESEWIGGPGGGVRTTLGSTGAIVIGIVGKANAKDCTGLGLLLAKPSEVK